jgi:hypothetical protein
VGRPCPPIAWGERQRGSAGARSHPTPVVMTTRNVVRGRLPHIRPRHSRRRGPSPGGRVGPSARAILRDPRIEITIEVSRRWHKCTRMNSRRCPTNSSTRFVGYARPSKACATRRSRPRSSSGLPTRSTCCGTGCRRCAGDERLTASADEGVSPTRPVQRTRKSSELDAIACRYRLKATSPLAAA